GHDRSRRASGIRRRKVLDKAEMKPLFSTKNIPSDWLRRDILGTFGYFAVGFSAHTMKNGSF
ncbi:MAG: hypothetical protein MJ065_03485, partial [Oscillospiraceae bacterium]|nr:hypothetical protein [Oscillospiraceae bacterium]